MVGGTRACASPNGGARCAPSSAPDRRRRPPGPERSGCGTPGRGGAQIVREREVVVPSVVSSDRHGFLVSNVENLEPDDVVVRRDIDDDSGVAVVLLRKCIVANDAVAVTEKRKRAVVPVIGAVSDVRDWLARVDGDG